MRRTLAFLLPLALLAPLAEAEPDAWPYLVRACKRMKEGRLSLDLARAAESAQSRRKHAKRALARFAKDQP